MHLLGTRWLIRNPRIRQAVSSFVSTGSARRVGTRVITYARPVSSRPFPYSIFHSFTFPSPFVFSVSRGISMNFIRVLFENLCRSLKSLAILGMFDYVYVGV